MNKLLFAIGVIAALVLGAAGAQAFNPQPEPPGDYGD